MADQSEGRLPDYIVIGAMKAGTTSLHHFLGRHPDVQAPNTKELDFFIESRNWSRGTSWYRRQLATSKRLTGESSPDYTAWPFYPGVPERMQEVVPDVKLIFVARDPVARSMSHYHHRLANGRESRGIDEALPDYIYLARGLYHTQIMRYLAVGFQAEQLLIIDSDRLRNDRRAVLREIFMFLGVDDAPAASIEVPNANETKAKRMPIPVLRRAYLGLQRNVLMPLPLPRRLRRLALRPLTRPLTKLGPKPETLDVLRRALADDAVRFRQLSGQDFPRWSI